MIDALQPVPGVTVAQLGGPGTFSKIFIRGLRVVDTSVLVDGIRVRDAADFRGSINPFLQDLMTDGVERVEVLRGSGSSLYGSNAVGGVVNLVPQEGSGPPSVDVGFEGGSLGLFRERARFSGAVSSVFGYSLYASRLDVNDGVHGNETYRNTSLGGHARYNIKPNMSLRANFVFIDGVNRLTDSPFPIGPTGNEFGYATGHGPVTGFIENQVNPDSYRFGKMIIGSAIFSHQVNSLYSYSLSFQAADTREFFSNGPDQSAIARRLGLFEFVGESHFDGHIDTFNVTNNLRTGQHNLITGGIEWEREAFTQDFTSPGFSTPRSTDRQQSLAVFGQDQLSLLQGRFQFLAAFRSQGFSLNNPGTVPELHNIPIKRALTGDGSIAYTIKSLGTKLRSHVGNSFRAPSLSERFTIFRGTLIGDPFLRPERGISVDGGLDQDLVHGRVRASATYFYSKLQQIITSTALFMETNSPGALSRGAEFSVEASPSRSTMLSAAYTYANSTQVLGSPILLSSNVVLPGGASVPSFSIPRHSFSFSLNQRLPHGINLNFNVHSASGHVFNLFDPVFFSQVLFTFRGYTRASIVGSHTRSLGERKQLTFYAKLDNLLNQTYFLEGFRAPGLTGIAGVKYRF
jgi:vitamin B12 transporter